MTAPAVVLPPLEGQQAQAWDTLMAVAGNLGEGWTLIGGQMMLLHQAERSPAGARVVGGAGLRWSYDLDVVVNLRTSRSRMSHRLCLEGSRVRAAGGADRAPVRGCGWRRVRRACAGSSWPALTAAWARQHASGAGRDAGLEAHRLGGGRALPGPVLHTAPQPRRGAPHKDRRGIRPTGVHVIRCPAANTVTPGKRQSC